MIEPTVGRIVWYWRRGSDPSFDQPEAATVAYVHGTRSVNLHVINPSGNGYCEQHVHLRQPGDDSCPTPYCEWMPYQKGQAAKTEQLEAAARENPTHLPT